MIYPIIFVSIFITILLFYWMYFKIKNPFWSKQPVNHPHHFYRKFMKPFIIKNSFYNHKYINPLHIKTQSWDQFSIAKKETDLQNFIKDHFCNSQNFKYLPTFDTQINPYFKNDKNAYISTYRQFGLIIGTIMNRSIHITLPNNNKFIVSYIDFLCVHKGHRRKNVAPELIQTHELFQRTKSNKKCLVSLFKKEGVLHSFTPLVKYTTFSYDLTKQINISRNKLPSHLKIIWFSLSTFKKILSHMNQNQNNNSAFLIAPYETQLNLLERKSIRVGGILNLYTQEVVASYWFRDTGFYVNSKKPNLECFGSIWNKKEIQENEFKCGFIESVLSISKDFNQLQLEAIGDNTFLSKMRWTTESTIPCAYYLYNYSHKTMMPENITIII